MRSDAGRTTSWWMQGFPAPRSSPLPGDAAADICVIGAGIAGLTTAYLLLREGHSVAVLDDSAIGGGATSRTSGHLASAVDDRYHRLERTHGADAARLVAQSHGAAVDRIERLAAEEGIACDFARVDGYLFVPPGASSDELAREEAAARRAGLAVELLHRLPLGGHDLGPALRFARQAQFHILKYLHGLSAAIARRGGQIHDASHVDRIERRDEHVRVHVAGGRRLTADHVVIATNAPIDERIGLHTQLASYRTYVVALAIPRGALPDFLAWDTPDPYHYLRVDRAGDHDVLIVGGEDHKTGQDEDTGAQAFATLEAWARERFAMAGAVVARWSGQVLEPVDGLAYLGRMPGDERVYVATGDSGNGLTHGTIAGMIITDQIAGRANPWSALYSPGRAALRSAGTFVGENLNAAVQYADFASGGDVGGADEIPAGTGAVLRQGLRKLAAYRDESGALHVHSAVCTHLGCVVHWNAVENSWDCPCHGSRFDKTDGHVLNGPAVKALTPVDGLRDPGSPRSEPRGADASAARRTPPR